MLENLRKFWKASDVSQEELARALKCSRQTVSNKLNGRTKLTLDEAQTLCELLGISFAQLERGFH